MVKLKNIKRIDNIGTCDIIPEDSKKSGQITVNLSSEELENFRLPEGYEWCEKHVYHAARNLINLLKDEKIPKEYLVMWC